MLILLSKGSAKALPMWNPLLNEDRAILYIDDEDLKSVYKMDHEPFPVKEMLTGNEYVLWGHSIVHFIRTSTIL